MNAPGLEHYVLQDQSKKYFDSLMN